MPLWWFSQVCEAAIPIGRLWNFEHVVNDTQETLMYVQDRYDDGKKSKACSTELIDEQKGLQNGKLIDTQNISQKTSYKEEGSFWY